MRTRIRVLEFDLFARTLSHVRAPMTLDPGTIIAGRYRVIERIGEGGMGEVHRAFDETLRRDVALKIVAPARARDPEARARLLHEARLASRVKHPGVVEIFDVLEEDENLVLVMELVIGESLSARLAGGPLAWPEAAGLVRAIAACLDAIHAAGLVHRDVKPPNVMVREDGSIALLDFGIAKALDGDLEKLGARKTLETKRGMLIGTAEYLSPEQAEGEAVGAPSDLFSLAVTAYELLFGRIPWDGPNPYAKIGQIISDDAPLPSALSGKPLPKLDAVFAKALQKDPAARHASAGEFADALAAAVDGEAQVEVAVLRALTPVHGPTTTEKLRATIRRFPLRSAIVLALVALGLLLIGVRSTLLVTVPPVKEPVGPRRTDVVPALACPLLEVSGLPEPNGWLGAAAADIGCQYATVLLGGRTDKTLVPAELLDLPAQPIKEFPDDPYAQSDARARSLAAARARAASYLDGRVTREHGVFKASLAIKGSNGAVRAEASASSPQLRLAVAEAVRALSRSGGIARAAALDPEVARWGSAQTIDAAWDLATIFGVEDAASCEDAKQRASELIDFPLVYERCRDFTAWKTPAPKASLDASSASRLVQTAAGYVTQNPSESKRVAVLLNEAAQREPTAYGRAQLASQEALWRLKISDTDAARAALLGAIKDAPRTAYWSMLANSIGGDEYARAAAAWEPSELYFALQGKASLELQLRYGLRGHYITQEDRWRLGKLAQLVLAVGDPDRLSDLVSDHAGAAPEDVLARDTLAAFIARGRGRFGEALAKERAIVLGAALGGATPSTVELLTLADLLGEGAHIADAWIERFVLPDDDALKDWGYEATAVAMCMRASRALGKRCFAKMAEQSKRPTASWTDATQAFFDGGVAYSEGALEKAAASFRPLTNSKAPVFLDVLPVEVFDLAGDADLGEKLDRDLLGTRGFAGVSPAHPRQALRESKRGDKAAARALAKKVVDAWANADVEVPVMAKMRALLK